FCSLLAPSDAILFQEGVSVKLRLPQEVDLSKLTSARLATLCEAEELDIHKDPKETAEAFRIRVREAFRRRVAETEQHGGTE
ncbi:hypothetical protein ACI50N_00005, partial [Escherichia coli]